ncbi:15433_t:CDS:2 [Entrophospora sp. SA101]|nr:15433_t:CDS:2 [Entrophospora sp. SA101]
MIAVVVVTTFHYARKNTLKEILIILNLNKQSERNKDNVSNQNGNQTKESQIIGCDKKENNIDTNTTTFDNTENNIDTNTTTFDNTENNIGERRRTKRRYREAIKGITKPAIRRLARRGE